MRPPFELFPELQSSRIKLRRLIASDAPNIVAITSFQRIPAKNAEDVVGMLEKIAARYQSGEGIHWGIEERSTGEVAGACGFYRGFANDSGEVGYKMKDEFRNRGYMAEAVKLMLDFGFNEMKLKKIFAVTAPDNLASQSVLRKNGFVNSGTEDNGDLRFHVLR